MKLEEIQLALLNLSAEDRRAFAMWFYNHEFEFFELADSDLEPSPEVQAELLRRCEEMEANPSLAIPVTAEYFDNLRKKLATLRASK